MRILESHDPDARASVAEILLRSLPKWFGIESALRDYVRGVRDRRMWIAEDSDGSAVGFVSVTLHSEAAAEIYVMAVAPGHHRRGIGRRLIDEVARDLAERGVRYLTVKTIAPSHPSAEYALTRKFYLAQGFAVLEEFPTLWGEGNPAWFLVRSLVPTPE